VAATVFAAPHALILALMTYGILTATGTDRAFAALYGFLELWLIPPALLAAAATRFTVRWRAWPPGILLSTCGGAAFVTIATLIIGRADTWS
jgi:hypothetical protein